MTGNFPTSDAVGIGGYVVDGAAGAVDRGAAPPPSWVGVQPVPISTERHTAAPISGRRARANCTSTLSRPAGRLVWRFYRRILRQPWRKS
ncbi:hypothetical protein GCM10009648_10880 [Tsukamurella spumae]